ncbi:threonine synthase [Candidatus Bathyarchaeota archaeon]|nr:threonine synthase [Candidatus Bathyarchaeota archaeon]
MALQFHSTNHDSRKVEFSEALLKGLAPDKGLFTPDKYPRMSIEEIRDMVSLDYPEVGFTVLSRLIGDQLPPRTLRTITRDAYNFPVPLDFVVEDRHVLRLDKGPTASFKDFAARTMARLMQYFLQEKGGELLILTATSGDTGGAVASAFHGVDRIKVTVLFPENEVSDRQRKQMTTLGGNVTAIAIDGKFDDCQALVKQAFADPDLAGLSLSSANSINVGRLLPQSVYYFWAFLRVNENRIQASNEHEPLVISVPSGNFGNLMGGLIAKQLGLPVRKFIAAVNANDEFPVFLNTGRYQKVEPSRKALSNAMNVGHPSNLARIVDLYGGIMDHEGKVSKQPDMEMMRSDLYSVSIDDETTRKVIHRVNQEHGYILEPHGAVGWAGIDSFVQETGNSGPFVSFETADPAKFPILIREIVGINPDMPRILREMQDKPEQFERIPREYASFKQFLLKKFS